MTNSEAIDLLDNLLGVVEDNHGSDYDMALRMAIDALKQPEHKTGKWIRKMDSICYWFECSECHKRPLCNEFTGQYELSVHCPNCGIKMEGE